jgi:hypothetical protein
VKVGNWNSVDRLSLAREEKDDGNMGEVHPMANKTFVITTVLVGPHLSDLPQYLKRNG